MHGAMFDATDRSGAFYVPGIVGRCGLHAHTALEARDDRSHARFLPLPDSTNVE